MGSLSLMGLLMVVAGSRKFRGGAGEVARVGCGLWGLGWV